MFNFDSKLIATASMDQTCRLWDMENGGRPVDTLSGHTDEILDVTFDLSGTKLATASADGMIC